MADDFASRAAQLAAADIEQTLIQATRDYEDAQRSGDEYTAASALKNYAQAKREFDTLTGAGQQQNRGELSAAQRSFLSRRQAGGDQLTPDRMRTYSQAHERAVSAGLKPDSPEYFRSIEFYCDHQGDGRIPPLTEAEAAKISGVDERTYAANAERLRALRRAGLYE